MHVKMRKQKRRGRNLYLKRDQSKLEFKLKKSILFCFSQLEVLELVEKKGGKSGAKGRVGEKGERGRVGVGWLDLF